MKEPNRTAGVLRGPVTWIADAKRCGVCARTDGLVRGWCPDHLPGAIDDLLEVCKEREREAQSAHARLVEIGDIVSRETRPYVPSGLQYPWHSTEADLRP